MIKLEQSEGQAMITDVRYKPDEQWILGDRMDKILLVGCTVRRIIELAESTRKIDRCFSEGTEATIDNYL